MNCATCRFFLATPSMNLDPNAGAGVCRRFPPTALLVPSRAAPGYATVSDHAPVKRSGWCGEFAPRLEVVS